MTSNACRVLVVDDDRINRVLLTSLLRSQGHRATAVPGGEEALAALAAADFDVVLLDVEMPGVDGVQVLQTLKRTSATWDVPVIMISAVEETASVVRCIELGAEDYLLKPFDPVLLRARINASVARKRLHDTETEYHEIVREQRAELEAVNRRLSRRVWGQVEALDRLGRLRRFLGPVEAEEFAVAEGNLAPHRRRVVVLVCGLGGVDDLVDAASPHQAIDVLDAFHETISRLADKFRATLGSGPQGGFTMFFNDPTPCDEPALAAYRMALAARRELTPLLAETGGRCGCLLTFGAAVAAGEAVLGEIGHGSRSEYVALGPVVRTAERLLGQAVTAGSVLLDAEAEREVGEAAVGV